MDSTDIVTEQTHLLLLLPLSSCCLKHSPDPLQGCLISLRQHNNSPGKKAGKHFRSELGGNSERGHRRQQLNCTCLTQNCLHNTDLLSSRAHSSWNAIVLLYWFSISSEVKKQCIFRHLCCVSLGKYFTFILPDSRVQYTKIRKGP